MNKPSYEIEGKRLVFRKEEIGFLERFLDKIYLWEVYLYYYKNVHSKEMVRLIFQDMIEQTKQRGEEFIVVRIPLQKDLRCQNLECQQKLNQFSFKDFFNESNVIYIECIDFMKSFPRKQYKLFYIPNDQHLTSYS